MYTMQTTERSDCAQSTGKAQQVYGEDNGRAETYGTCRAATSASVDALPNNFQDARELRSGYASTASSTSVVEFREASNTSKPWGRVVISCQQASEAEIRCWILRHRLNTLTSLVVLSRCGLTCLIRGRLPLHASNEQSPTLGLTVKLCFSLIT